jgi:hypothetical protein
MQYPLTGDEVEVVSGGEPHAVEPSDDALSALADELREYLSHQYPVENTEVSSDSDPIVHDPRSAPAG